MDFAECGGAKMRRRRLYIYKILWYNKSKAQKFSGVSHCGINFFAFAQGVMYEMYVLRL